MTFESIIECNFAIPEYVPSDARDLIERLLKVNPSERIGSGVPLSSTDKNDMDSLKAHPFFEGVDFASLHLEKAPID